MRVDQVAATAVVDAAAIADPADQAAVVVITDQGTRHTDRTHLHTDQRLPIGRLHIDRLHRLTIHHDPLHLRPATA